MANLSQQKRERMLEFLEKPEHSISAKYEIRVSATPNKRVVGEFYEIKEQMLLTRSLITRFMYINKDLDNVIITDPKSEAEILLEKADELRKENERAYIAENENVRIAGMGLPTGKNIGKTEGEYE